MSKDLLRLFLEKVGDQHAQLFLFASMRAKRGSEGIQEFTFNWFNVRLGFSNHQLLIDDDLKADCGEQRLSLDDCMSLLLGFRGGTDLP